MGALITPWNPKPLCEKRPRRQMDVIIVPGVAFDKNGGRMGRGGGYYDALLRKAKKVITVGLCFQEQVVKKFRCKRMICRVDRVITD